MVKETPKRLPTDRRLIETALRMASERGWGNLRLYQLAGELEIPLDRLHSRFADMDAVANGWFTLALEQMLRETAKQDQARGPAARLQAALAVWLDALAVHREVTVDMLRLKLHPPHVHHWVPMIFDLSRLVHLWLDTAGIGITGRKRQLAEIGLTATLLTTLGYWARDDSPGQLRAKGYLERRLQAGVWCLSLRC